MGQPRLGLCPTRNRPDGIGWSKISPAANRRSRQVRRIKPSTGDRRVSQRHRSEKTTKKR